jgi:hypothetical protein
MCSGVCDDGSSAPARHFARGKGDPAFRTKLAIGADLAVRAREAGFVFRAVAADSAYPRGGPHAAGPAPSWPRALRTVHAWLSPRIALRRWWPAWPAAPPPPQLQALIDPVAAGCGLHLYIRN